MGNMLGKDALMQLLHYEGVEYVFGIPGATEIHFMDALEEAVDMPYILGLNELVCAAMAETSTRALWWLPPCPCFTTPGQAAFLWSSHQGSRTRAFFNTTPTFPET